MDIFDILGPVMVGPSSSHTAGAVRIGSMARTLLGTAPKKAAIHLYGSFADTGLGHGTDRALVAGLLGMKPDDLRIPYAFEAAKKQDLHYTIDTIELRDAHPNTAVIEVWDKNDKYLEMQASSLGGGRIMVDKLDGISVNFTGEYNTLVVRNQDESGTVAADWRSSGSEVKTWRLPKKIFPSAGVILPLVRPIHWWRPVPLPCTVFPFVTAFRVSAR